MPPMAVRTGSGETNLPTIHVVKDGGVQTPLATIHRLEADNSLTLLYQSFVEFSQTFTPGTYNIVVPNGATHAVISGRGADGGDGGDGAQGGGVEPDFSPGKSATVGAGGDGGEGNPGGDGGDGTAGQRPSGNANNGNAGGGGGGGEAGESPVDTTATGQGVAFVADAGDGGFGGNGGRGQSAGAQVTAGRGGQGSGNPDEPTAVVKGQSVPPVQEGGIRRGELGTPGAEGGMGTTVSDTTYAVTPGTTLVVIVGARGIGGSGGMGGRKGITVGNRNDTDHGRDGAAGDNGANDGSLTIRWTRQ